MVEITLKDPGMYDKRVKVTTLVEVDAVLLKHNRHYTTAIVRNTEAEGSPALVYKRNLGERDWFR